jgi:DNA replication and repair protein RecF
MILERVILTNFRSYQNKDWVPDRKLELILGPNGAGKTNLLEATHLLCTGKSFRLNKDLDLIKKDQDWARIEAIFDLEGRREKRVLKLKPSGPSSLKNLEVDGVSRLASKNLLPVIVFEPEQLNLLHGGKEERRAYLDERISFLDAEYAARLKDYKKVLAQRNRLLKLIKTFRAQAEDLFIWNIKLSELAAILIVRRRQYLEDLDKRLEADYRRISKKEDLVKVSYIPSFWQENQTIISSELFKKLEEGTVVDINCGFTRLGPHRDDWRIELNGQDAAFGASRGEVRSLILSLKMYEFEHLKNDFGITPIVILDDVMSELDQSRQKELLRFFDQAQVLVSGIG